MKRFGIALCVLFLAQTSHAAAPDFMAGFSVGVLEPTPMTLAVGPTLKFADWIDASAFFDPFRLVMLGFTGGQILTLGGQIRVRGPDMVWAPVVGVAFARTIAKPAFNFLGLTISDAVHYVFSFGIEHKMTERIIVGVDLLFAFRERQGEAWAREDLSVPLGAHMTLFFK